jgi:hypothetical protein
MAPVTSAALGRPNAEDEIKEFINCTGRTEYIACNNY